MITRWTSRHIQPARDAEGFIERTDEIYSRMQNVMEGYAESGRLYLMSQRRQQLAALAEAPNIFRYLDLSAVPPVLRDTVSTERTLQLKEILVSHRDTTLC